jgi:hypothetical protein
MMLKRDPFALIFEQGDDATRLVCLSFFDLANTPHGNACLVRLLKQQRVDGAFPGRFDPGAWGMQETVRYTLLLLTVGMPATGVNVSSAVQFILRNQNPDGGWCENPALEIAPEMTWLSNERSITWLTADAVELLRSVGRGEQPPCQAAVTWLRAMQNHQGGWPSVAEKAAGQEDDLGDPDATAQITFLMGEVYGREDAAFRQGKRLFERHLDACARDAERGYWVRARDGEREKIEVYTLTHLLLSSLLDTPRRLQEGYDVSDPRVRRILEVLVEIQGQDGGWRPFFLEASSPLYTVLAVEVLVLSGAIPREDLLDLVEPYAT